jgi:hypothetical protein
VDPTAARLRARLLEFLKFRVLAAQETFFDDLRLNDTRGVPEAWEGLDIAAFRTWLAPLWPEALALTDGDLRRCLADARRLYLP